MATSVSTGQSGSARGGVFAVISIVFGLLTACMFATSALVASRTVKVIGAASTLAWAMLVGFVVVVPWLLVTGVPEDLSRYYVWMALAGCGNVGGILLAGSALRIGKVGVVSPILATEGAISAVLAALFGESIAPIVAFLLMVIVAGIVLSAVAPDPQPLAHERPVLTVVLATLGAVCFGLSLFAVGQMSDDLPMPWVLLPARLVGVVALAIPLALTRNLRITRPTLPLVVIMGFAEVLGFVFFTTGAQYQVAVTSVLASQFAPISAVAAYLLFKERLGRLQVLGVVVLVLGVTGLSLVS